MGDFIELKVPVLVDRKYRVVLYATMSFDYGIARISLNGLPGKDLDLWSEKSVASGPIDLGLFDLPKGDAVFRLEIVGSNPLSRGPRFYSGLDCISLKPATTP